MWPSVVEAAELQLKERGQQLVPTPSPGRKAALRGPHHAKNVELGGTRLDQPTLWNAYRDENWPEVERLVTDDVIRQHAAAGTHQQVCARYDEYRSLALDELIVGGIDDALGIERALGLLY